tara:strand:- start:2656 stop:2916 length:261 start_codon:yes stop_codon:yes gene_type:complete
MSWKEQLHPKSEREYDLREMRQRREDKAASYDKPPKNQKAGFGGKDKCKVRKCEARTCKHNAYGECQLNFVDVNEKGYCSMYEGFE